ncbi:helix-turn-helix domain-containing protein [Gordonibacter massiliensis (ex Traore et al. 2017)]|uniref:helix-turn-helix domain-containing protein n=1 Tax=Gordonibacter massiliensis (ex Traore et al. 2017) TaxID=1841863 RepID=UPI001C8C3C76|nr:helix-turn-helix transcriptional regulator [Gordonibacter massiliensis (ex Traore et al. 2017)]MBX9033171.1 helix-turn-helix transcriptional regulator [Gordonibacter massiliensis (ex Traore et al. 2017)]
MVRDYEAEKLFGVELEETPQTLAYSVAGEFSSAVMDEAARQGLTLAELARRMGIKQPTLCGMLRGESNMTVKTMARMALALDCGLEAPRLVGSGKGPGCAVSSKVVAFDSPATGKAPRATTSRALRA